MMNSSIIKVLIFVIKDINYDKDRSLLIYSFKTQEEYLRFLRNLTKEFEYGFVEKIYIINQEGKFVKYEKENKCFERMGSRFFCLS
jgi:hypothetical protein